MKTGNPEAWRGRPRRRFIFLCVFIPGSGKQTTPPPPHHHRPPPSRSRGHLVPFYTLSRFFAATFSRDSLGLTVLYPFFSPNLRPIESCLLFEDPCGSTDWWLPALSHCRTVCMLGSTYEETPGLVDLPEHDWREFCGMQDKVKVASRFLKQHFFFSLFEFFFSPLGRLCLSRCSSLSNTGRFGSSNPAPS